MMTCLASLFEHKSSELINQIESFKDASLAAAKNTQKKKRSRSLSKPSLANSKSVLNELENKNGATKTLTASSSSTIERRLQSNLRRTRLDSDNDLNQEKKRTRSSQSASFASDIIESSSSENDDNVLNSDIVLQRPAKDRNPPPPTTTTTTTTTTTRKRFTETEDNALKKGVEEFGEGHWAKIILKYHEDLKGRSAGNIKDRWRNMKNNH